MKGFLGTENHAAEAGARGERLAADWLQSKRGMRLLARNWRNPRDRREELDLVCEDRGVLVFVEVKTRSEEAVVRGYCSINGRKRLALRRAAFAYLGCLPVERLPRAVRFDVVEVRVPRCSRAGPRPGAPWIVHLQNIPLFGRHFVPRGPGLGRCALHAGGGRG